MTTSNVTTPVWILATFLPRFKIGVWIHEVWLAIVITVGFIGNFLSLAVVLKPKNRRLSGSIYLSGLAINDCIGLVLGSYLYTVSVIWKSRDFPDEVVIWECKIGTWIFHFCSFSGILIILAMTLDRVIAVKLPLKAKTLCTPRRAKNVIVFAWLITSVYSCPQVYASGVIFMTYDVLNVKDKICTGYLHTNPFIQVYSWINIIVNSVIPFTALLIMNSIIISAVRHHAKYFKRQNKGENENGMTTISMSKGDKAETQLDNKDGARDRQLTTMLLLVSFTLLVCTLPNWVRLVLYTYKNPMASPEIFADYALYYHISNKQFYTNNSINFFIYCIGGSKFRKDLASLFKCKLAGNLSSDGSSIGSSTANTRISVINPNKDTTL